MMTGQAWLRMLITMTVALLLAGWVYLSHPGFFSNRSAFVLQTTEPSPTPGATALPVVKRPSPTPATPRLGRTLHLDDIWITPYRVEHSQGMRGMVPNFGDEFLVVHLHIRNRSQVDYPVRVGDFQLLDSHGQIDPPLLQDFSRKRLREVRLIPHGYTDGTLTFEAPDHDPSATLIYQPDTLDPTKRKEWLLR